MTQHFLSIDIRQLGLATLETAIIFSVLTAVCLGAVAVFDYMTTSNAMYRSLDREIHNTAIKTSLIKVEPGSGELLLEINEREIRDFIDSASAAIAGDVAEVAYSIANIDPETGALLSLQVPDRVVIRGPHRPLQTVTCPGIDAEIRAYAELRSAELPSTLAIPDAGTERARFLSKSVVVAARAETDLTHVSLTGLFLQMIGLNPRLSICSISQLRGEVTGASF